MKSFNEQRAETLETYTKLIKKYVKKNTLHDATIYFYDTDGNRFESTNAHIDESGKWDILQPFYGITVQIDCLHKAIKNAAEKLGTTIIYTVGIFPDDDSDYSVHKAYRINGKTDEYEQVSLEWLNEKLPPHERMMEGDFELPDEPIIIQSFNKLQVVRELTGLDGIIPIDSYIITYGAAMCIHGIMEYTRDIDLSISKEAFSTFISKGYKIENYLDDKYTPYIKFNNVIDLFLDGTVLKTDIQYEIDKIGFRIQTIQSLLNEKQASGREKDLKDVELIKAFLNKKSK